MAITPSPTLLTMKNCCTLLALTLAALLPLEAAAQIGVISSFDDGKSIFLGAENMDDDPQLEIAVGSNVGGNMRELRVLDSQSGAVEWEAPFDWEIDIAGWHEDSDTTNYGASPFADLNSDGKMELIFYYGGQTIIVGFGGTTSSAPAPTLERSSLEQNYPTPFGTATTISFELAAPGRAVLTVYDLAGRRVATLLDREMPAGPHSVQWDGRGTGGARLASGMYVYQLEAGGRTTAKQTVHLR